MNVKEASNRWGVAKSTVRKYCSDGIIPEAYKEEKELMKGQWIIPEMDKPPAGRSGIVKYLKRIINVSEGAKPKFNSDIEKVKSIYKYISDCGFTTEIDIDNDILSFLQDVKIVTLGYELIETEEKVNPIKTTTSKNAELDLGVAKAGYSKQTEIQE
ncbi:hypothetical protein AOC36_10965 [Erysipelothrix larvae]|uniref:Uncharacterized protein n=1 Tax=Erysipelothrix larvae TaxID=1514105 RepID=A0A0X8H1U5_9FIRM|nr:helix-turn-helix domain-containing protein [Erysipelothrix larvae]AMC94475.1 hypothetical protein AOC36_10965 [Erysipelothrix larvae]